MSISENIKDPVDKAADQVRTKANDLADDALDGLKQNAQGKAEEAQLRTGLFLDAVSAAIEAGSSSFETHGYRGVGSYGRTAAKMIRTFSEETQAFEPDRLVDDAGAFVKRNPLAAYGALAVAGFAVATLLKRRNSASIE